MITFIGAYVRIKTILRPTEVLSQHSALKFYKDTADGFIAVSYDERVCFFDSRVASKYKRVESISERNIAHSLIEFENIAYSELQKLREELGVQNVIVDFGYLF